MSAVTGFSKDTGTYEIEKYNVKLNPLEDGSTRIKYYQKWKVLSGNIPWITIGLANSKFSIIPDSININATSARNASSKNWSGVRIKLDRKYLAGDTFEVTLSVIQHGLLHSSQNNTYLFNFIPGWYDRADINELTVELEPFKYIEGVTAHPTAALNDKGFYVWRKTGVKRSEKLNIKVYIPKSTYSTKPAIAKPQSPSKRSDDKSLISVILFIIFIPLIVLVAVLSSIQKGKSRRYGSGGKLGATGSVGHKPHGVVACACACVACACACACAGGGAAGCDRKMTFTCPLCKECEKEDCSLKLSIQR